LETLFKDETAEEDTTSGAEGLKESSPASSLDHKSFYKIAFFEIYNDKVYDLLNPTSAASTPSP